MNSLCENIIESCTACGKKWNIVSKNVYISHANHVIIQMWSTCDCFSKAVYLCLCQIQDEGQPLRQHQWQNRSVPDWSCQQVCLWLMGLNLEQYIPQFTAKNVDGEQLLQLNNDTLKVSTHTHATHTTQTILYQFNVHFIGILIIDISIKHLYKNTDVDLDP